MQYTYKDPTKKNIKMVVVEADTPLYRYAQGRRHLIIEYSRCRINTKPQLIRCKVCRVLGHTRNNCPGLPLEMENVALNRCAHCSIHLLKRGASQEAIDKRTNHKTNAVMCPIRLKFERKYFEGREEVEEEEDGRETSYSDVD